MGLNFRVQPDAPARIGLGIFFFQSLGNTDQVGFRLRYADSILLAMTQTSPPIRPAEATINTSAR